MPFIKIVQQEDSQTARIPAELAYDRTDIQLEMERVGDEIRIRPARRSLADAPHVLARFSPDVMSEGRGDQEQAQRVATDAPVLIAARGESDHVLLRSRNDPSPQSEQRSLAEVLALPVADRAPTKILK